MNEHATSLSPSTEQWMRSGRHVELERHRLFVYERGTGPTLLLLHGFPTSCYDWRGVIERLAERHRCVAFDFPGYGLSDKPEAYSYSLFDQADCVEALAVALGICEAHVVSHDMGTSVHCELLAQAREGRLQFDVPASTFTNGSMLMWRAKITPFQELLASNASLPSAMELCAMGMPGHVAALKALMQRPSAWDERDETIIHELLLHSHGNLRIPALAGYMRERYLYRERWLGALGWAQRRVQFVWADGDPIATIEMGRELHELYPAARYTELPNIGHFLIAEDPAAVADAIRRFEPA